MQWKRTLGVIVTAWTGLVGCSSPDLEARASGPETIGRASGAEAVRSPREAREGGGEVSASWLSRPEQPEELGWVAWSRDWDGAVAESRASGKPMLVLFDEVPGCHTVLTYGRGVLSHPLVVEAAETLFVPVVVYNNVQGRDAELLRSFGEPSWNNPVVRIIDADREALAPRLAGDYSVGGLAEAMVEALRGDAPRWLALLVEESTARRDGTARQVFSMYCFWSGEAGLGGIDGVVETRPGFAGGREVVEVTYDPDAITRDALIREADGVGRAMGAEAVRASDKDDKYNLAHTSWRHVPMTPLQASRANALVARRQDPAALFSPRQRWLHARSARGSGEGWPVHLGRGGLRAAFDEVAAVAR